MAMNIESIYKTDAFSETGKKMMPYGNVPNALVQQKWNCCIKQNQALCKAKRERKVVAGNCAKDICDGFKTWSPNSLTCLLST